jgi:hypothetical protein
MRFGKATEQANRLFPGGCSEKSGNVHWSICSLVPGGCVSQSDFLPFRCAYESWPNILNTLRVDWRGERASTPANALFRRWVREPPQHSSSTR